MAADLRSRALPTASKDYLSAETKNIEDEIARLDDSREHLEADVSLEKKASRGEKYICKKIRVKKENQYTSVS
jgi:hypothetical protein